jgi:transposase
MAKPLLPDDLWALIEPLLPPQKRSSKGSRPPVPHRVALTGILFVLKTGIPWEYLPQEMGCSGMTCWRRLYEFQKCGVWNRLHVLLLSGLQWAGAIASSDALPFRLIMSSLLVQNACTELQGFKKGGELNQ